LCLLLIFSLSFSEEEKMIDVDGNAYETIKIGEQIWTKENLQVEKFRNGDIIKQAKTKEEWKKAAEAGEPAWCYAENDPSNEKKYGKLYNWYAVNDSLELAPEGWHIPSDQEWMEMENVLKGRNVAGDKLKSIKGWGEKSKGNNESGFNGLPGGARSFDKPVNYGQKESIEFFNVHNAGYWWTPTEVGERAFIRILETENMSLRRFFISKDYGMSIRCMKN
jgi:uncharacterized protein (TIGR02145 family)